MATVSGNTIFARARTLATQTGQDANSAITIDNLGGLRAMLNEAIRILYRNKAKDAKFLRDIVTRNTIAITDGVGSCPDTIMREFMHLAQVQDTQGSLIAYYDYNIDQNSGVNYNQLGYLCLLGDEFIYTEPSPGNSTSYTDDLYITVPTFPTFPASMADNISFPNSSVVDDLCTLLAQMVLGKIGIEATLVM